ncbi:MAG: hypothetical protein PWP14_1712 [Methanolobus sp.]|nr:hypothetical protein [Methanolobus sp.]
MKRLTISMSDELFDKLDRIDNKSLFIRKLLEKELEMLEDISDNTTEPWVPDINILKGSVDELFLKLGEIEKHLNGKVVACPSPESAAELLASGSLITYKDRPLAHIANEAANPIIIPLATEKYATDAIQVTGPELTQQKTDKLSPLHPAAQAPTDLPGISVETAKLWQEPVPSVSENTIMPDLLTPEVPTGHPIPETFECNLQTDHSTGPHTLAGDLKELNALENQQAIIPESDRQPTGLSEPVQAKPQPHRQRIPESEPTSIVPDSDLNKVHDSQTVPFTPDSNQHVIPISESSPTIPDLKQHTIPGSEQIQEPDTGLHVIPMGKSASVPLAFDQQLMEASKQDPVMHDLNQHVVPVNEHVPVAPSFSNHINQINEQVQQMPLFDQQEKKMAEHTPMMPVFGQHAAKEQELVMPEFDQQAGPDSGTGFVIPELNPQAMPGHGTGFVMPEFKAPVNDFMTDQRELPMETSGSRPALAKIETEMMPAMPSFNVPGQAADPAGTAQPLFRLHDMSEPARAEKTPPFIAPPMPETLANAQAPSFTESQPAAVPPFQQQSRQPVMDRPLNQPSGKNTKPGKLEGNILMYMPRGAKVKRSIIKSLVSKQFSDNEIEAKISELVSAGVLVVNADNGEQYLVRP